jgi:hypothetical protein
MITNKQAEEASKIHPKALSIPLDPTLFEASHNPSEKTAPKKYQFIVGGL